MATEQISLAKRIALVEAQTKREEAVKRAANGLTSVLDKIDTLLDIMIEEEEGKR